MTNDVNRKQGVLVKQYIQSSVRMVVGLAMATLLLAISHSSIAVAQTANTLKVSPVRTDTVILPGASKTVQTTVTNLTGSDVTVRSSINDFVSADESGTPALILDDDKYAESHSLKRFITPIGNVVIPAGQAKTINVLITVPEDAEAGGYFGAVRFSPADPDDGGQVNLSASVASLILLTVPGDFVEELELTDFAILQNGGSGSNFRTGENLTAAVRFENTGAAQIGPFGKLSVMKGDTLVYETDFNNKDPRDMILPDSARRWSIPIDKVEGFGNYTVLATFTYGEDNQTIEVTKSFWVIPQYVIIAAIAAAVLLVGLIIFAIFMIRHRKSRRRSPGRRRGRGYRLH